MSMKPRAYLKREFPPEPKIERRCLRCGGRFEAEGRFNRLCPACKNLINIHYSSGIDHYRLVGRVS